MTTVNVPLAMLTHALLPRLNHVVLSMHALIAVTEKGAQTYTPADAAANPALAISDDHLTQILIATAKNAVVAAGFVFFHSTCENAIVDLCKMLVTIDPAPWLERVKDRKVSYEQVRTRSVSEIEHELVWKYLDDLERKSFPEKLEVLISILQPVTTKGVIPGFDFSLEEFRKLDELRHRFTHEPSFVEVIEDPNGKLKYFVNTVQYFIKLAELKYPGK
ncbi:MAG: hypothetical protein HZA89_14255 [Verrucomicrobia bacterium]|nr:hypothetical protein [Verrucomicrobiota bacterium]